VPVGQSDEFLVATATPEPRTQEMRLELVKVTWTTSGCVPAKKLVGCPRPVGEGKKRLKNPIGIGIADEDVFT
jgi:hypothetical protein